MASSYSAFASGEPSGSDTGPIFASKANANDLALWYGVISGQLPGWVYSQSGGTAEEPTSQLWTNGAQVVRHSNTWTSGNLTGIVVAVSQDGGATFATAATIAQTFDASGNMTASTGGGGFVGWLSYLLGKVKSAAASLAAHIAGTGSSVHGLGTIATQSAAAVNLDGGTIDGVTIGAAVRAIGNFLQAREAYLSVGFASSIALDWGAAGAFGITASAGSATVSFANLPPSGIAGGITVEIINGGLATWTWPAGTAWPGGSAPVLSSSGRDRLTFFTRNAGASVDGFLVGKGMA